MSKVMKRVLCICLSAVLVMGAAACGSKKNSGDDNRAAVEQEQQAEQKEEPEQPEEKEEAPEPYVKGTVEGNHFESAWLNMQADFSEDYVMATEEEIAQMQAVGMEVMEVGEETQERLEEAQAAGIASYEMMVMALTGIPNCSVTVEKLALQNITEKQYLKAACDNLIASISDDLKIVVSGALLIVSIAGEDFMCMEATLNMSGVKMNSNTYVRAKDGYMIVITMSFTGETEEQKDALLDAFR